MFLKMEWISKLKKQQIPRLRSATNKPILLDGTILLLVQLGDLKVGVWFGLVQNLSVDFLLENLMKGRYIHGVFFRERKVVPRHSSQVPIVTYNQAVNIPHHINEEDWGEHP